MPSLTQGSTVTFNVSQDQSLTIQNPSRYATVENPVGTPVWGGGEANASIALAGGTCKITAVEGGLYYELGPDYQTDNGAGWFRAGVSATMRLRSTGGHSGGTVTMDSRSSAGVTTSAQYSATLIALQELVDYAYPGDDAVEVRITTTGSAAAEVL